MSQSRCATRSPRNWRERESSPRVPAASRHLPPSGAQSTARCMASRCRRDCCLVQARMLNDKVWGVVAEGLGAIENALLDAKAKALGVSCYALLGGKVRDRIRVYWSHCATWRINHPTLYK